MRRTTIMADDRTIEQLKGLARERGVSFAEVVREALDEKAMTFRPKPASMGVGRSSPSRTARSRASRRQPPRQWR